MSDLAHRHDGVEVSNTKFNGTVRLEIELTDKQIEDLPDGMSPTEFAGNVASSRVQEDLGVSSNLDRIVQESDEWKNDWTTVYDAVVFVE